MITVGTIIKERSTGEVFKVVNIIVKMSEVDPNKVIPVLRMENQKTGDIMSQFPEMIKFFFIDEDFEILGE